MIIDPDKRKNILGAFGLVLAMLALISAFAFKHSERTITTDSAIESDRLELYLRLADSLRMVQNGLAHSMPQSVAFNPIGTSTQLYKEAKDLLEAQPNKSTLTIAKLAVISHELAEPENAWLEQLDKQNTLQAKSLRKALGFLYNKEKFEPDYAGVLRQYFPAGWYQDKTLLTFYAATGSIAEHQQLEAALEKKSWSFLTRMIIVGTCAFFVFLAGVIIIIAYLILSSRKSELIDLDKAKAPANYGWPAVYKVFGAWLITQILIGYILQSLTGKFHLKSANILFSAVATTLLYLISNLPGLFYIYYFALKPKGIGFLEGIKLKQKGGKLQFGRFIGWGVLAWLAAIPIVLVSYAVAAKFFNAHGSSNPIIVVVMQAARKENLVATLIFYATLAVFAPICEEILFRGFLYTYLRRIFGLLPAAAVSAGLFALVHLDPGGMLPLFCLGYLFAFLVEKTDSILPSIIAHGLWNGGTFTLVLFLFGS